jgi:hypothetical protein
MNLASIKYANKAIGRALLSCFNFNRVRKARSINMDLNSSAANNEPKLEIDASDTAINLMDSNRAVSTVSGKCIVVRLRE